MSDHQTETLSTLLNAAVADARALIRAELALALLELREEAAAARRAGIAFAAAAFLAVIASGLLAISLGGGIADLFDLPTWVGYGVVAVLLFVGVFVLASQGRAAVSEMGGLPQTTASLRETWAWMQSKSSGQAGR